MTAFEIFLLILFFVGFILLIYSAIILLKRKEYENKRIMDSYNVLTLSVFILGLYSLVRALEFSSIAFDYSFFTSSLLYFDILSNLVLLPLFGISLLVSMLLLKNV